jgi:hypothetical protein
MNAGDLQGYRGMKQLKRRLARVLERKTPGLQVTGIYILEYVIL